MFTYRYIDTPFFTRGWSAYSGNMAANLVSTMVELNIQEQTILPLFKGFIPHTGNGLALRITFALAPYPCKHSDLRITTVNIQCRTFIPWDIQILCFVDHNRRITKYSVIGNFVSTIALN